MKPVLLCCVLICGLIRPPPTAADELRDPTRPPAVPNRAPVAREAGPVLSAVMGAAGARIAIFNGRLVRSGGSVGSYAIEAIFADGVRYRHEGLTVELLLPRAASFKKPSTARERAPPGAQ